MSAVIPTEADPPRVGVPDPNPALAPVARPPPDVEVRVEVGLPEAQAVRPAAPSATAPGVIAPRDRNVLRSKPDPPVTPTPVGSPLRGCSIHRAEADGVRVMRRVVHPGLPRGASHALCHRHR